MIPELLGEKLKSILVLVYTQLLTHKPLYKIPEYAEHTAIKEIVGVDKLVDKQLFESLDDLDEILSEIEKNDEIKVIVLTGEGNAFAAGADIKSMPEIKYEGGKELALKGQSVFNKLEKMDKPSICFINGVALGGGLELAMSADMRVASEKEKVGKVEPRENPDGNSPAPEHAVFFYPSLF